MISATCGVWLLLTTTSLGPFGSGGDGPIILGARNADAGQLIAQLQTSPRWMVRHRAARLLRRCDWRSQPGAVDALSCALLGDRNSLVRAEAAQSLAKMAPCSPSAQQALSRAASVDPDLATRRWARKGLVAVGNRCQAPCQTCPSEGVIVETPAVVVPGVETEVRPVPATPLQAPSKSLAPPTEMRSTPQELAPLPAEPAPAEPSLEPSGASLDSTAPLKVQRSRPRLTPPVETPPTAYPET
jgi:hypothetical protein